MFFHHLRHRGWLQRLVFCRLRRKLRLDETQQDKLKRLEESMRQAYQSLNQMKRDTHSEIGHLLAEERLDRAQALRLLELPRFAINDSLPDLVDSFAELFDSLRPEQRQGILSLWQKRHRCAT